MKVSRAQVAQHRMRIMEAAAKLFRQRGLEAVTVAEIMKAAGASQLAFEIQALAMGANWSSRLFRDAGIFRSARVAILRRIEQVTEATPTR